MSVISRGTAARLRDGDREVAALIFLGVSLKEDYRPAIAVAVVYVVALIGFAAFGRHRLVLSPEKECTMSGGMHGDDAMVRGEDADPRECANVTATGPRSGDASYVGPI